MKNLITFFFFVVILLLTTNLSYCQIVNVGKGSYTTQPPKFIDGTYNPDSPAKSKPTGIYGPCIEESQPKKWQFIYPAVTENFRKSGKLPTTNQWWSSAIFKFMGGTYTNYMSPNPLITAGLANGLLAGNLRAIKVNDELVDPNGYSTAEFYADWTQNNTTIFGIPSMNADSVLVDDYGDWHVKLAWKQGNEITMKAIISRGSPYIYFDDIKGNKIEISHASSRFFMLYMNKSNKRVYCFRNEATNEVWTFRLSEGSSLSFKDSVPGPNNSFFFTKITIDLKNKNYFSVASLFDKYNGDSLTNGQLAELYAIYAFNFIKETKVDWLFDSNTNNVTTIFSYTFDKKEGNESSTIISLFPHQYNNLSKTPAFVAGGDYPSPKGWMKSIQDNQFSTVLKYPGMIYQFPDSLVASGDCRDSLKKYLQQLNYLDTFALFPTYGTTYSQGKVFARMLNAVKVAQSIGDTAKANKWLKRIKNSFEEWLTVTKTELDSAKPSGFKQGGIPDTTSVGNYRLFYYNNIWKSIYGFPAGFYTESQFNDHHFTWGYFIKALTDLISVNGKDYASDDKWGGIIKLLIRDIVGDYRLKAQGGVSDKGDTLFPRFRNWDPYCGIGLASGHADFGDGNNMESSSEGMDFCSAIALFGGLTGDNYYRDLGIYLYTTLLKSIENYWFDVNETNFWREARTWQKVTFKQDSVGYTTPQDSVPFTKPQVTMCWDKKSCLTTFFGNSVEKEFGMNYLPYNANSVYLGRYPKWGAKSMSYLYKKTKKNGTLPKDTWQNIMWQFICLYDDNAALSLYNKFPNFTCDSVVSQENPGFTYGEDGTTRSYTYYWLRTIDSLGVVDTTVFTSSTPFYGVFHNQHAHKRHYIAHNPTSAAKDIVFSDGFSLNVPANKTALGCKSMTLAENPKPQGTMFPYETINFDTVDVGSELMQFVSFNNPFDYTLLLKKADDQDSSKGFTFSYMDEDHYILPGHSFVASVTFQPKKSGYVIDTIKLELDTTKMVEDYDMFVYCYGYGRGGVAVPEESVPDKSDFNIVPNPSSGTIALIGQKEDIDKIVKIEISDINGYNRLAFGKNELNAGNLNLRTLVNGMYFIRIYLNDKVITKKFIIIK